MKKSLPLPKKMSAVKAVKTHIKRELGRDKETVKEDKEILKKVKKK